MKYRLALIDRASGAVVAPLGDDGAFHPHGLTVETDKDGKVVVDRSGEPKRIAHALEALEPDAAAFDGLSFGLVNDAGAVVWPVQKSKE